MAARLLNIGGNPNDPSYRYKMPALMAKVEGRGNGIKTVIVNMVDIAKALHTDPAYPTKYFGCELGAQSRFNRESGLSVVNGAHQGSDLQALLNGFLERFVLCPQCKLPEVDLVVEGRDSIVMDCKACGNQGTVDIRHKLATYILNNPPGGERVKSKKEKKGKKGKKNAKDAAAAGADGADGGEGVNFELSAEDMEALKVRDDDGEEDDDDEDEDDDDEEEDEEDMEVRELGEWLAGGSRPAAEVEAKLKTIQENLMCDEQQICLLLVDAAMWDCPDDLKEAVRRLSSVLGVLKNLAKNVRCQRYVLRGLERVCYVRVPELGSSGHMVALIKYLYDQDAVEEEAILKWHESPSKSIKDRLLERKPIKAARKDTKKLIEWLKSAEEESD